MARAGQVPYMKHDPTREKCSLTAVGPGITARCAESVAEAYGIWRV